MATREAIETLKQNWYADPCWDLEGTEGFEEHRDELRLFSESAKACWKAADEQRIRKLAHELGIPDNLALAGYIARLHDRIAVMEATIAEIINKRG